MSIIILQSVDNPAIIKNNFKDGIELKKGSEIGLVSLSINKISLGSPKTQAFIVSGIGNLVEIFPENSFDII